MAEPSGDFGPPLVGANISDFLYKDDYGPPFVMAAMDSFVYQDDFGAPVQFWASGIVERNLLSSPGDRCILNNGSPNRNIFNV